MLVGADLPFPINLPEIEQDADGRYNRPEFLNYYFGKTNIQSGPENPAAFLDEFFLQARDPENQHTFTYRYTVATPAGLQQAMDLERLPSLYLGSQVRNCSTLGRSPDSRDCNRTDTRNLREKKTLMKKKSHYPMRIDHRLAQ